MIHILKTTTIPNYVYTTDDVCIVFNKFKNINFLTMS